MFLTWPLKKFGSLDDRKPNMVRNLRWSSPQDNVFHVGPWENEWSSSQDEVFHVGPWENEWSSSQDKVFHVGPWENETRNVSEPKHHMNNHWMVPYRAGEAIFIQVLLVTQQRIYW